MAIRLLEAGFAPVATHEHPTLETKVFGRLFKSPVGLAAGFDKQGRVVAPLLRLGLGYVEVLLRIFSHITKFRSLSQLHFSQIFHVASPALLITLPAALPTQVGGVTPLPQRGNPRPRMFRLAEDEAIINRFGLNRCDSLQELSRRIDMQLN